MVTTAASLIATTIAPFIATTAGLVEDIITGFTETPEVPRSSEVSTFQPVAAVVTAAPVLATTPAPAPTTPAPPPRLSGKAREALIAHLGNIDLGNTDKLVLTPRQRQAIAEELEYQQLGLQPFTDPTPWQRLSRDQQTAFNQKFLSLRRDLQEYAKTQFTTLSEDRQAHAFQMFLTLDLETLNEVISTEQTRERAAQEEARAAQEAEARRQQQAQPSAQDLAHQRQAEAQIQEAVRLQKCLANPSGQGC